MIDNYQPHIVIDPEWPVFELGKICEILDKLRKPITKGDREAGPYPYYGATGVVDWVADYIFNEPLVLVGEDGAKWQAGEQTAFVIDGKTWVNNHAHVLRPNRNLALDVFLATLITQIDLTPYITGVTVPKLNQRMLSRIQLPLPPIVTQQAIVSEIEAEQSLVAANHELVKRSEQKIHAAIARVWGG